MNVAKAKPNRSVRRRSGRPTKEQAGRLTDHIIDVATRLFSESSFEATSIDLIAAKARVSKQTFYARFVSKDALFAAVIRKGVAELFVPATGGPDLTGPIEAILVRVGIELSKRAQTPAAIALARLVASEAHQFPQLALAYKEGSVRTHELIAGVFSDAMRDGQIQRSDAGFLAQQFLYAVIEGPVRDLVLGDKTTSMSEQTLRERIVAAVGLFLNGCRDRPARRGQP
jgi:TetR/AcrR family transcriptional regulator, mexJK operon transcriptional repressor